MHRAIRMLLDAEFHSFSCGHQILVPLPTETARKEILKNLLPADRVVDGFDFDAAAARTEHFSGADMALLCKEAAMRPVRKILRKLATAPDVELQHEVKVPRVTAKDMDAALSVSRPSCSQEASKRYLKYHQEFGSGVTESALEDDE